MRLWRIVVLCLGLGLVGVSGQAAQCTASPVETEKALAAMEAARQVKWPLPVPRSTRIDSPDAFRGALLLADASVFQIETVTWEINSAGALDIVEFQAYTADGTRTSFAKSQIHGKRIESPSDLGGFTLGNPRGEGKTLSVSSLSFATDREGFLTISQLSGVDNQTGESIEYAAAIEEPCGLRVQMGCDTNSSCTGACGAAPGCPCTGTVGACKGYSNSVCSGTCPEGMVCNGSVTSCSCIAKPKPTPAPTPLTSPGTLSSLSGS